MSMTLFVLVDGHQREPVKVSPMTRLDGAIEEMLRKIGKPTGAGSYELRLKKKAVDPSLPVRFSGLQNRDTLELRFLGSAGAGPASAPPAGRQAKQPSAAAAPAARAAPPARPAASRPAQAQAQSSSASSSHGSQERGLIVFHEDLVASSASASGQANELPDDFYEFTAQDFSKLQQCKQQQTSSEEGRTLQTRAMREREQLEKARAMPPVRVRVVLPSRWCLQFLFKATDRVADIHTYVLGLVECDPKSLELFTAPPRSVLPRSSGDASTLYSTGLVPSARIYLSSGRAGGEPTVRPEILQRHSVHSAEAVAAHGGRTGAQEAAANAKGKAKVGAPQPQTTLAAGGQGASGSQEKSNDSKKKGMPKWFKGFGGK